MSLKDSPGVEASPSVDDCPGVEDYPGTEYTHDGAVQMEEDRVIRERTNAKQSIEF